MKRLLTFLALCCFVVTGAWADGFTPSTEVSPVKYVISVDRDNMVIATDFTYSVYGASQSPKGEFAFISASESGTYYLYETTTRKYMKLAEGAQASAPNGVVPTASKNDAQTFTITPSEAEGKWWIKPTTMNTFLNFHGGWRSYTDNTNTVGFYDSETDPGSLWDLTLTEAGPVKYVLTNAANMSVGIDLTYSEEGTNHSPRGRFSFISTGVADTYYLYENTSGKYVKLADGAGVNGKNGVAYADTEGDAQTFTVTPSDVEGKWWIKPTTMNTFLNFYGGVNQYKNTDKVGFYDHGNDNGSRWSLIEPLTFKSDAYYVFRCKKNSNYATYNANATDGGVNHLANAGNSTYSSQALFRIVANGDEFNIIPAAAPSQYVYAISTADANSNVGIGALGEDETAATSKYVWKISKVDDTYFTIIPKDGTLSWNCRGSVNGVNVIGQWSANTDDCRWTITEVAAPIEAGKTYTMTLAGKNVNYNAGGSNFTLVSDTPEGNDFLYTVDGDPADGYTLYSVGASNYIAHTKDNAYTAGGADDAVASPNETAARYDWYIKGTDIFLKIHGTNNNYLNNRGDKLSTWNDSGSLGNSGSMMTFTVVEEEPVTPVEEAYTLSPADGATVESLSNFTLEFTGEDADVICWDEETLPTLTKEGSDPIQGSVMMMDWGLAGILFEGVTDGTWTLNIPDGAFIIQGVGGEADTPVKGITATYTVGSSAPALDEIATFDYGWLPGTTQADDQWTAWTGDAPEVISGHCATTDLYVIEKRYEFTNDLNKLQVTFLHQGGNHRTDMVGVDVTGADGTVYSDYHHGYTGNAKADNVYTINNIPAGTYTVRYITTKHWEEEGKTTENNTQIKGHITPVVTEPIPQITDLANLSNDKAYVLICERGQLTTSNGQLAPVAKDREDAFTAEANMFAIIKSGDKYYLWSIAEDGYVRTDKAIHTLLAAQPITLTAQQDGTFYLKIDGNTVNMQNNASNILMGGWNTADGGNKYAIYEVDDFADAEVAIAAISGTWRLEDGHIYTIKAHFMGEGQNALYLTKDSNATLQFAETATPVQSYWIARATGDNSRPWKFQAAYGDGSYLDANNAENALSTTGLNMEVGPIDKNYCYMKASLTGVGERYIGTYCTTDTNYPGFGLYGSTCYGGSHNHSGWTTYYEIAEVTDGTCVYDVISTNEDGGVVVSNITDFNGAAEVSAGGVVVTAQTITAENLAPKTIEGFTGNIILDTEAHIINVQYGKNYTVAISGTHASEAKVLYNGAEYGNTESFFIPGTPTVEEIAATYYDNEYAKITIDEENTTINVEYKATKNAGVYSIGASTQNILPGKWYVMTQTRGGETPVYNNGENADIKRAGQNASTVLAPATKFTGVADKYLIRFTEGDYEGTYKITFADGGLWKDNQVKTEAGNYFIKPATNTSQNKPGLAINVTNNGTSYNGRLDNNGAGSNIVLWDSGAYTEGQNNVWYIYPVELDDVYTVTFKLGEPVNQTITGTAFNGQTPVMPFTVPDYVTATYSPELAPATGEATYDVSFDYNDLMPFTPGGLTTVDIDIRNHYYFHVEERTITIDGESKKLWVPCISPKAPTFDDDAAYIWRMEGDWYNGFRFHNDQLAKDGEGDVTACHITYKHKEVLNSEVMEQMEGMKGATSLTEKTYTLVSTTDLGTNSRATLTADANDRNSYFELVHATGNIQHYNGEPAEWQFRLMDQKNLYLNFRDYSAVGDNPDSLLCLYGAGYGDNASSFTFHKNEICTEDDRMAVAAMIDAIDKGAVGAIVDKDCDEYRDLQTLRDRIADTSVGCTRALFDIYTEKLVNSNLERKVPAAGEAYRIAVRTKKGNNLYLKDDGGYTTDSLQAAVYVLAQSGENTYFLAGNNNEKLHYFQKKGGTEDTYSADDCDFSYTAMNSIEADGENINATGAAMYATVSLNYDGNVATMNVADESAAEWDEATEAFMNDELSSAFVMEPVAYPFNKPNFTEGTGDGHEGVFASIWLPFPMQFPDGVQVYKGTQERDVNNVPYLGLTEVDTNNAVAQGGYILYANTESGIGAGKQIVMPAAAAIDDSRVEGDAAFVGSTEGSAKNDKDGWTALREEYPETDWTPYVLAKKTAGVGFYKYVADTYPKGKAIWMKPATSTDAECVQLSFDDIISAIEALNGNTKNAEIFDLQGRRLDKVEKGKINVINGQKIMFK